MLSRLKRISVIKCLKFLNCKLVYTKGDFSGSMNVSEFVLYIYGFASVCIS